MEHLVILVRDRELDHRANLRGADRPQTDHHPDATPGRQAARLVVDPSDADQPLLSNARSASGNIYPYFYPYFVCAERHSKRTHCTRPAILVDKAEQLVADHYRTIQIPADVRQRHARDTR
jgi:hypothetical protein